MSGRRWCAGTSRRSMAWPEAYGLPHPALGLQQPPRDRPRAGPDRRRAALPALVVSFNDEGYLDRAALEAMLAARGHLQVIEIPHDRYVGAKIGIHNPQGEKVGTVGRLTNTEYLFVASETALARARRCGRRDAVADAQVRPGSGCCGSVRSAWCCRSCRGSCSSPSACSCCATSTTGRATAWRSCAPAGRARWTGGGDGGPAGRLVPPPGRRAQAPAAIEPGPARPPFWPLLPAAPSGGRHGRSFMHRRLTLLRGAPPPSPPAPPPSPRPSSSAPRPCRARRDKASRLQRHAPAATASRAEVVTAQEFMRLASMSDRFEVASSRLAQQKSQNAQLKQFAEHMVRDHTKTTQELRQLIQQVPGSGAGAATPLPNGRGFAGHRAGRPDHQRPGRTAA